MQLTLYFTNRTLTVRSLGSEAQTNGAWPTYREYSPKRVHECGFPHLAKKRPRDTRPAFSTCFDLAQLTQGRNDRNGALVLCHPDVGFQLSKADHMAGGLEIGKVVLSIDNVEHCHWISCLVVITPDGKCHRGLTSSGV